MTELTNNKAASRNKENNDCYNCIFQRPFWLDAVAYEKWDEVLLKRGSEVVARMPYVLEKRFGLQLIRMPFLSQTIGPWLLPSTAKYAKQLSEQKDLMFALIEQLPPFDYFQQNFHYSITNWLPFYWKGFEQTTRYTYVLWELRDLDRIWDNFMENIRRETRKAERKVVVRTDLGVEIFLDLNEKTFMRQGMKMPYSRELVLRIDKACGDENRRIFFAEDAQGRLHAAIYIVWDANSAYYLMGGADPELRNSGATSLLMWEAIQFASKVTQRFDFEGSMIESVERFFRAFGAVQMPYFQITKMSPKMKMLQQGKNLLKALTKR